MRLTLFYTPYCYALQLPVQEAPRPVPHQTLFRLVVKVVQERTLLHLGQPIYAVEVQLTFARVWDDSRLA